MQETSNASATKPIPENPFEESYARRRLEESPLALLRKDMEKKPCP